MELAPIVLFVYNRPLHTKKTLEALALNDLANKSILYVFADGLKEHASKEDLLNSEAIESLIKEKQWCKEVILVKRDTNFGLADNIVKGVSSVLDKHDRVIVLEDDIVTSAGFLRYMNDSLHLYESDSRVMHVSGYSFPMINPENIEEDTYFYRVPSCWGWATWRRAWKYYRGDATALFVELCDRNLLSEFDFNYSGGFIGQLNANILCLSKTWAVKWYASTRVMNGLALHPKFSFVNNIGFDSSGTNSATTNLFTHEKLAEQCSVTRIELKENKYASSVMLKNYRNAWTSRVKSFFANRVKNYILRKYLRKNGQ